MVHVQLQSAFYFDTCNTCPLVPMSVPMFIAAQSLCSSTHTHPPRLLFPASPILQTGFVPSFQLFHLPFSQVDCFWGFHLTAVLSSRVSALSDFRHRLAKFAKQEDQYQNIVLYVESLSEKLYTSSFCGWVIFLDKIKISSFVGDLSRWLLQHKSERSASQCKNLMAAFYPEYPRY